jgi:hypothetical protein
MSEGRRLTVTLSEDVVDAADGAAARREWSRSALVEDAALVPARSGSCLARSLPGGARGDRQRAGGELLLNHRPRSDRTLDKLALDLPPAADADSHGPMDLSNKALSGKG